MRKIKSTTPVKASLIVLMMLNTALLFGQETAHDPLTRRHWELGLNLGLLGYMGDVSTADDPPEQLKNSSAPGVGLSISRQLSRVFGFRGDVTIGKLKGLTIDKTLSFKSDLIESTVNATVNISEILRGPFRNNSSYNVYGVAGAGVGNFRGSTFDRSTNEVIRSFGYHNGHGINGYELDALFVAGIMVDFDLGNHFKINGSSVFKFLPTDNLDGVVHNFPSDFYNYTSVELVYKLPFSRRRGQ